QNATQVIFGETDDSSSGHGGTGPVSEINTNGAIDIGSSSVVSSGIIFNGGMNPLSVTTTGDSLRLNGAVTLATSVSIDTDSTNTGAEGGNVEWTAAAPLDSAAAETNDLIIDSGNANIVFGATVGAAAPLKAL